MASIALFSPWARKEANLHSIPSFHISPLSHSDPDPYRTTTLIDWFRPLYHLLYNSIGLYEILGSKGIF